MEKEFVPYKEALALKELGFDEPCLMCYFPDPNYNLGEKFDLVETNKILPNQIKNIGDLISEGSFKNTILAPLHQQAFRWFREKYGLEGFVTPLFRDKLEITFEQRKYDANVLNGTQRFHKKGFNTHEEAELECLKKLIEIIKNGNS